MPKPPKDLKTCHRIMREQTQKINMTKEQIEKLETIVQRMNDQMIIHQQAIAYILTKIEKLCDEEENSAKEQETATKENQEKNGITPSQEEESASKLKIVK